MHSPGDILTDEGAVLTNWGYIWAEAPVPEVVVMSSATYLETAEAYAVRTGQALDWVLKDTIPLVYTPGWQ